MREKIKKILRPGYKIFQSFLLYIYNYWITNFPVYLVRRFYLANVLKVKIGRGSFVHMGCFFYYGKIAIGNNSVIGRECHLLGDITIRNNVSITAKTYIFAVSHRKDCPTFKSYSSPVIIDDYVWVGARAMILPGVHIGKGAILGATSTATKNIPDFTVYVGAPAKQVGVRSTNLIYELNYAPYFE